MHAKSKRHSGSKNKFKVVITDCQYDPSLKAAIERSILCKVGADVHRFQLPSPKDEAEVIKVTQDADLILTDLAPVTRSVILNLQRARGVVSYGVGYNNIDVKAATEKGVYVCNTPNYITYEVADHTASLILSLTRKIPWANMLVKAGGWDSMTCWEKIKPILNLDGRAAGIIGFGRIGRQVAERLKAFKLRILVYDPYVADDLEQLGFKRVKLTTLLKESDIVTVNAALTKESWHLIGEKELSMMKKSAILVNTSRGSIVDQKALYEALRAGRIRAAGLDVLEDEPPDPDNPLLKLDNVIITPHMSWYSVKSAVRGRKLACEEAARVLKGEMPKHLVNPEVLQLR